MPYQLPKLTDEQRAEASRKAAKARAERYEIKKRLGLGELKFEDVLEMEEMQRIRVVELLKALPGVGRVKSVEIVYKLRIPENRRVQGLGHVQKARLVEEVSKYER